MMPDADIYQGSQLVGHFEQTLQGIRLTYLDGIELENGMLGVNVPTTNIETKELPTYFLNLLPDGARLARLLDTARNRDDDLELLLRVGWDTIGDLSVVPHGAPQRAVASLPALSQASKVSFWELFEEGLGPETDHAIPGAQEKISANTVAMRIKTAQGASAILKLNPPGYPRLVENEDFFLRLAKHCGIKAAKAQIITDREGEAGLLVTRFDRVREGKAIRKLHQEDGCQILDIPPSKRYNVTLRQLAEGMMRYATSPTILVRELLQRTAFCYLIGNADFHAKNASLLWSGIIHISPAYDLLSTLPYPRLEKHMAMPIEGKDDNLRPREFIAFGGRYGVPQAAIETMLINTCRKVADWLPKLSEIGFDDGTTERLRSTMQRRLKELEPK
jgi:serine/threonine-protein kinase HipA